METLNQINWILVGSIGLPVLVLIVTLIKCYIQAPPSTAIILSGFFKNPRFFIGTGGIRIPFLERMDTVHLGQITVDVNTSTEVPTSDFINVKVDAVAKVRVIPTQDGIQLAAKNFLNLHANDISRELMPTLQGNMREIVGQMDLKTLNVNRDNFAKKVLESAAPDMTKLGIEILSLNIQSITDSQGLIEDLGADNIALIVKNAKISKANADKEVAIAEAQAKKIANDSRVEAETAIAQRNNDLAIKQAELQVTEDTKKAEADIAYELKKQDKLKELNEKTVEAEIIKTRKEQSLAEERVKVMENKLKAEVNAKADADRYDTEVKAQASKFRIETDALARMEEMKRQAEAKAYTAEQEAAAARAKAEAARYAAEQEAEGIRAKGEAEAEATKAKLLAEAEGIRAKGEAEAEAMDKKSEAFKKSEFARLEMILDMQKAVLPQMAENVAKPMGNIRDITIYGQSGQEASGMTTNVPVVMQRTFDVVKNATGVDMAELVRAEAGAEQTRNVNLDSKSPLVEVGTTKAKK